MNSRELIATARGAGRSSLSEADGKRLLAAFGVSVPRFIVVADSRDVATDGMAGPFAVKVLSQDILHKSDAGAVALKVENVAAAIDKIAQQPAVREARVDGYLVEEMCAPGLELAIGAVRDGQFGMMLMVGLGGIFIEVLKDVSFRLCPIGRDAASAMLSELRGAALLEGARGGAVLDREAVVDLLVKLGGDGGLLDKLGGDIAELDLNPVFVHERGVTVADARFILSAGGAPHSDSGEGGPCRAFRPKDRSGARCVDDVDDARKYLHPTLEGVRLSGGDLSDPPEGNRGGGAEVLSEPRRDTRAGRLRLRRDWRKEYTGGAAARERTRALCAGHLERLRRGAGGCRAAAEAHRGRACRAAAACWDRIASVSTRRAAASHSPPGRRRSWAASASCRKAVALAPTSSSAGNGVACASAGW